jgi:hypothetical protein
MSRTVGETTAVESPSTEQPAAEGSPAEGSPLEGTAVTRSAVENGTADRPLAEQGDPHESSEFRAASTTIAQSKRTKRRTTITFYLSESLRNRARAAYRSTSFAERDSSWSDMLTKALLAEVERRERAHNNGERFIASEEPLTPGRPIGY